MNSSDPKPRQWNTRAQEKARRLKLIEPWLDDGFLKAERIVDALEALIAPGDRVALEGNRSRPTSCRARSRRSIRRACTTCTCCSRASAAPST
jgi:malonate decarboxylase alpha subunit